jgi:hypothetical protein
LIALDDGAQLIGLQRIVENDAAEEPGNGSEADAAAADDEGEGK